MSAVQAPLAEDPCNPLRLRQRPLRSPGSAMVKGSLLSHLGASCEASVPGACYQVSSCWRCWLHRQQERDALRV